MGTLLTVIHIFICFILIIAVLLQSGKAADLAGAFGGVGSQTVFGPRGAGTLLSKVTTICAVLFMLTSLGLWILSEKHTGSVIKKEAASQTETVKTEKKAAEKKEEKAPQAQEKKSQQKGKEQGKENKIPG
ncbi:MAG: preprotein translocase subunit SecG [Candidatus Aminicenantales bacterium]